MSETKKKECLSILENPGFFHRFTKDANVAPTEVSKNGRILLANSNQWYFNNLVKIPCHKTPYRCSHRLSLSSQSSRSCAGLKIKALKDKGLEFANSIPSFFLWLVQKAIWGQKSTKKVIQEIK